jgi:hypothetical protein
MTPTRTDDVAVVGSPSSNTQMTLDLLQEAAEERLVGALAAFDATQNGFPIISVGQVVGLELRNRWHEDAVFRNLIKRTGEIPPITNRQDTRVADLSVSATFRQTADGYEPDVLGMIPPTGTRVYRVDQPLLDRLLSVYRDEIVYLGRAYANDIRYPMWFKHFDQGPGGAGEAYHLGVFGKTGSGKSGLAKMILALYSRHPQLGVLVIDPQGEFSLELSGTRVGQQGFPLDRIMREAGRQVKVYRISDIQLDDWGTFEEMLHSLGFCEELTITHPDNARRAAEVMRNELERGGIRLTDLGTQQAMQTAMNALVAGRNLTYVFATQGPQQRLTNRIQDIITNRLQQCFGEKWQPIAGLFVGGPNKRQIFGIVQDVMGVQGGNGPRPVIVVDLSSQNNQGRIWTEELQRRLIGKLLSSLVAASAQVLAGRRSANVLVVLDEAHRHAPSGHLEDDYANRLRSQLRRAVRETRKYGLGWFFVSQTLGGMDTEILQQLRILAFGFGLSMGSEFDRLREYVGGDEQSLELYRSFRDPQSFPRRDLQEFPFVAVGPISPLAFSGKPVFFSAFTDWNEFVKVNGLRLEPSDRR